MPIEEIWKPIKDFEGLYEVSDKGRVRTYISYNKLFSIPKMVTQYKFKRYYCVKLKGKRHFVHRLVLETFIGKSSGMTSSHLDGNPKNNNLDNLIWESHADNNGRRKLHRELREREVCLVVPS